MNSADEWRNEFYILYNSINSNIAPSLDDYEISVLLTNAQEQLVKQLYSGTYEGFESTESARRMLDALVKSTTFKIDKNNIVPTKRGNFYYANVSIANQKVMYITSEYLRYTDTVCDADKELLVVPTTQDMLYKHLANPFKQPNERRALRLDTGEDEVQIISNIDDYTYVLNYIEKPSPILLDDFTDDPIDGETTKQLCKLDSSLHRTILTLAVNLAQQIYLK